MTSIPVPQLEVKKKPHKGKNCSIRVGNVSTRLTIPKNVSPSPLLKYNLQGWGRKIPFRDVVFAGFKICVKI